MSVQNNTAGGESVVLERPAVGGVYASLFEKINLNPVSELSALDTGSAYTCSARRVSTARDFTVHLYRRNAAAACPTG